MANSGSSTRTCHLSVLLTALPIILAHLKMEDSSRALHIPPQPSRGRHPCAKRSHCDAHRLAPCRGHRVHGLRRFCLFRIKTLRAQRLNSKPYFRNLTGPGAQQQYLLIRYCPHTVTVYNRATIKVLTYLYYEYYPTVTEWGQYQKVPTGSPLSTRSV